MTIRRAALAALLLLAPLAACGDGDDDRAADETTTTEAGPAGPERIVSLSPTATETLFAIGAGEQVVAVDDQSTYPEEAPRTDLSGYQPNVEAIAAEDPELVVLSNDIDGVVAGLEALDIEVLLQPAATDLPDVYEQIEQLGQVTGHVDEAEELTASMRREIGELEQTRPDEPLTYYYELDPTFYSVTSNTFVGKLLGLANLDNIADAAQSDVGDSPQLSSEFIVQADPDLIILADTKCCDQDAAALAERPGWDALTAGQGDGVVELDDDIASRWGPRIVDLLRTVLEAANALAATATTTTTG